ncbi:MAG: divalent-cation tolerance protein CutA [Candidatus Omnitrophica bacterium]|nr:divalent-cation tolerance protein CutA [Candidatus Omnitrophota bacterium]
MKRASSRVIVVLVTCPTAAVARRLARHLVTSRLAACVNIVPGLESLFWWQGKLDRCREALLLIKTTSGGFERLRRDIRRHHPYESPEIIALPVRQGDPAYLQWVRANSLQGH